jgi:hypothetical protein
MKPGFHYLDFTRSCMLNGVGMLVLCAPSLSRERIEYSHLGIGQYFQNVGYYLHAAIENESPLLAEELRKQENQLELHLPT